MATKEKLTSLFEKKKKVVKEFMTKVASQKKFGVANGSIKDSAFSDTETREKICEVLAAVFCDKANVELKNADVLETIHALAQPAAKVFDPKYKKGKVAGIQLKTDLEEQIKNLATIGIDNFDNAKKIVNKFSAIAKGIEIDELSNEEVEIDELTTEVETLDALNEAAYVKEAEDLQADAEEIKSAFTTGSDLMSLMDEIEGLDDDAPVSDDIIEKAQNAIDKLEGFDIDAFIEGNKRWKKRIPDEYFSNPKTYVVKEEFSDLNTALTTLSEKEEELKEYKKISEKLFLLCRGLASVASNDDLEDPPASSNPLVRFSKVLEELESTFK